MSDRRNDSTQMRNPDLPDMTGINVDLATADARSIFFNIRYALPLVFLLILRFLFTYALRILFLVTLFATQYRICASFNDQVALKGQSSKKAFWFLFWWAIGALLTVSLLAPAVFGVPLWPRFLFFPYHQPDIDFLGVLWVTCLTDMSFRIGITALKTISCILLPTYSTQPDSFRICSSDITSSTIQWYIRSWIGNVHRSVSAIISPDWDRNTVTREDRASVSDTVDIESGLTGSTPRPPSSTFGTEQISSSLFSLVNRRGRIASGNSGGNRSRANSSSSSDGGDNSSLYTPLSAAIESSANITPDNGQSRDSRYREMATFLRLKRAFRIVDCISLCIRSMLPSPVWLCYFVHGPGADIIAVAYVCFKWLNLISYAKMGLILLKHVFAGVTEYGSYSTAAEIARTGSDTCSICFDPYMHPVTLSCSHVFCEHCVYEWLEHENTCPVCRARVSDSRDESHLAKDNALSALPIVI